MVNGNLFFFFFIDVFRSDTDTVPTQSTQNFGKEKHHNSIFLSLFSKISCLFLNQDIPDLNTSDDLENDSIDYSEMNLNFLTISNSFFYLGQSQMAEDEPSEQTIICFPF